MGGEPRENHLCLTNADNCRDDLRIDFGEASVLLTGDLEMRRSPTKRVAFPIVANKPIWRTLINVDSNSGDNFPHKVRRGGAGSATRTS